MDIPWQVVSFLSSRGLHLATAESCTAGYIASLISSVPGSGSCLDVGFVTYSPTGKSGFLGVREETMKRYGLTSEEVAREMLEGALSQEACCADVAVLNTGVADAAPGDGPPQGTQCFAWSYKLRPTLLAIMGHDLRDPLQAIDMVVTLMGRGLVSNADGVKRIEYLSQRMQSLIAYILDVSRLHTGVGLAMDIRKIALSPLLYATIERAREAHPGVEMTVAIDDLGDCLVDPDRLVQGISNLLSNARHHGDMRYPIEVTASRCGNQRRIDITNRIPVGALFMPGPMTSPFNVSSSRNPRNKTGLGLGLYIANAIAMGLGGALEVDRVNDDARFVIVLRDDLSGDTVR